MATVSVGAIPLAGDDAFVRQRMLRRRMRALAVAGLAALAAVAALAIGAYPSSGLSGSVLLFAVGAAAAFEGLRQADRRYVAPLLARCQDDFSRQMAALFGPVSAHNRLAPPRARRD